MKFLKKLYWKWLYRNINGKIIYEVVKDATDPKLMYLHGPVLKDSIYLATGKFKQSSGYDFVQVINGGVVGMFKKNELIFLDEFL